MAPEVANRRAFSTGSLKVRGNSGVSSVNIEFL
jgi:hypothetical protein